MKKLERRLALARDGRTDFHQERERKRFVKEIAVVVNDLDLNLNLKENMRQIKLMVMMMK